MKGYIGTKSRERHRRRILLTIFSIVILLFIYYTSIGGGGEVMLDKDGVKPSEIIVSLEEYELRISEKDQEILFKDNQINSLVKKNKLLSESMDLLNSEIEKNLNDAKKMPKKEIEGTNAKNQKLNKENQKLQKELHKLNSSILQLKKDYKTMSNEYLKLNLEIKKSEEKALQSERLIIEQSKIIEAFKDKTHH